MRPAEFYSWHFMPWPYLPDDFDERYDSGWVTVPNSLFDREKAKGLYGEYLAEMVHAEEQGFDGLVLNEHHQNIYGLMPSPNLIAAALSQRTSRARIVILGNLLPLALRPLRVAEEYAMLDQMTNGRLVAGFAMGGGQEFFNYNVAPPVAREQYWEAIDLIVRAWTEDGPFAHDGKHYPTRYVNPWPRPFQRPHPPVWIPGALSAETMSEVARRGYTYFLSTRTHLSASAQAAQRFAKLIEDHGDRFHPFRMGFLLTVYVADTDEAAREESKEAVFYFLKNCCKGHLRRQGRMLTFAPGSTSPSSWDRFLSTNDPTRPMLGDARDWNEVEHMGSIIVGSPATVRRRLLEYVRNAHAGIFLIQFHIGNLSYDLTLKSQRLFATQVMPELREESAQVFAREFPALDEVEAVR